MRNAYAIFAKSLYGRYESAEENMKRTLKYFLNSPVAGEQTVSSESQILAEKFGSIFFLVMPTSTIIGKNILNFLHRYLEKLRRFRVSKTEETKYATYKSS